MLNKRVTHVDMMNGLHRRNQVVAVANRFVVQHIEFGFDNRSPVTQFDAQACVSLQHFPFVFRTGVFQSVTQHEAVQLCFRKFEGARLLDRILSCNDQKWSWQRIRFVADCHSTFLHRFQQRSLHFRSRSIDFVGK